MKRKQKKIKLPIYETLRIADKIMCAMFAGIVVTAFLTSPFGLYSIVVGGVRYYFRKEDFHREIKRLNKRGYVALTKTDKGWVLKLLTKGRLKQAAIEFRNLVLPIPKNWDGKWRLFSFDIPEEERKNRDLIRRKLKQLGLYNIQRSLFSYPHDCRKELGIVSDYYGVGKYVTYMETSFIDIDKELRKHFGL
jgi:hypothetical protein